MLRPFTIDPDTIQAKRARLVVVMSILTLVVMSVDLYNEIVNDYSLMSILEATTILLLLINLSIFLRFANLQTASTILVSLISFMAIASLQVDGFGRESGLFWSAVLPLPIFILLGARRGVWLSVVNATAIFMIFIAGLLEWIDPLFNSDLMFQMSLGYIAVTFLIYYFERLRSDYEKRLKSLAKERETLLREVNHRVKNNMQIIISMLRLQADRCDDEVKTIVKVAENRIRSMLSIHELLYNDDDLSDVNTSHHISKLIDEISQSLSFDHQNIHADITSVDLSMEYLTQLGLVINELLTNSIKYAHNSKGVHILVSFYETAEGMQLEVRDNGVLSPLPQKEGLGTIFVRTIVERQLGGTLTTYYDQGHIVIARCPRPEEK